MLAKTANRTAPALILVAFLLRALMPVGYMPAAWGSGSLFVLCPDQLPAGVSMPAAHGGHAGHQHHSDRSAPSADACDFGHLAAGAAIDATIASLDVAVLPMPRTVPAPVAPGSRAYRHHREARAPPA